MIPHINLLYPVLPYTTYTVIEGPRRITSAEERRLRFSRQFKNIYL